MEIEKTLEQRGETYGEFRCNALCSQNLKTVMHLQTGWNKLTPTQKEALDMCATKISRILTGDPSYLDNWHDMQGYLKLVEDDLKK